MTIEQRQWGPDQAGSWHTALPTPLPRTKPPPPPPFQDAEPKASASTSSMNRKQAKLVRDLQPVLMNGEEIADHHPRSGHRATPRRSDPSASHAVRHGPEDRCVRQETGGYEHTDFTYRLVTSTQHKKGIMTREIAVHGSGLSMEVRNIRRTEVESVAQVMWTSSLSGELTTQTAREQRQIHPDHSRGSAGVAPDPAWPAVFLSQERAVWTPGGGGRGRASPGKRCSIPRGPGPERP